MDNILAVSEFVENILACHVPQSTPTEYKALESQLYSLYKDIPEGNLMSMGEKYPDIRERYNVFLLVGQIEALALSSRVDDIRQVFQTYGALQCGDSSSMGAVRQEVASTPVDPGSLITALLQYGMTIPLRFPTSEVLRRKVTDCILEEKRGNIGTKGKTPAPTNREEDLEPKRAKTTNPKPPTPTATRQQEGKEEHKYTCASVYHSKYGVGIDGRSLCASAQCKFCIQCHMLEGLFGGYRVPCRWSSHAFPPTEDVVRSRTKKFPALQKAALNRLKDIQSNSKAKCVVDILTL